MLLRINDCARALNTSVSSVYAAIERGELPVIATGAKKGYRIHPRDLEEYLSRRRRVSPEILRLPTRHLTL